MWRPMHIQQHWRNWSRRLSLYIGCDLSGINFLPDKVLRAKSIPIIEAAIEDLTEQGDSTIEDSLSTATPTMHRI